MKMGFSERLVAKALQEVGKTHCGILLLLLFISQNTGDVECFN